MYYIRFIIFKQILLEEVTVMNNTLPHPLYKKLVTLFSLKFHQLSPFLFLSQNFFVKYL